MSRHHVHASRRRRLLAAAWAVHRWLGVGFGLVVILISVTGAALVIHHPLESLLEPEQQVVSPGGSPVALTPVVQRLAKEVPGVRPTLIAFDARDSGRAWKVYLRNDEDRTRRFIATVNPYTGEVLSVRAQDRGTLTGILLQLHFTLLLGKWGTLIVAAAGVALVLGSITGFYLYRHALRDLWRLPRLSAIAGPGACRSLHRWVGAWTLLFNLLIGTTGVWFMTLVIPNRFDPPRPAPASVLYDHARLPDLDRIVSEAWQRFPGAEVLNVSIPQRASGKIGVGFLHRDATVWHKFSFVGFDAVTGELVSVTDARERSFGEKFRSILSPLHFGLFGARWVQVLYFVGGLAPAFLAATGLILWRWRARRSRGPVQATSASSASAQTDRPQLPVSADDRS